MGRLGFICMPWGSRALGRWGWAATSRWRFRLEVRGEATITIEKGRGIGGEGECTSVGGGVKALEERALTLKGRAHDASSYTSMPAPKGSEGRVGR